MKYVSRIDHKFTIGSKVSLNIAGIKSEQVFRVTNIRMSATVGLQKKQNGTTIEYFLREDKPRSAVPGDWVKEIHLKAVE